MPSPRERLLSNQRLADGHFKVVHSPDFEAACDLTLLQIAADVAEGRAGSIDPAGNYAFINGARHALSLIQTIADPAPTQKEVQRTDRLS